MSFNYLRVDDKFRTVGTEIFCPIMHNTFWIIWHIVGLASIAFFKIAPKFWHYVFKINPNIIIPVRPLMLI